MASVLETLEGLEGRVPAGGSAKNSAAQAMNDQAQLKKETYHFAQKIFKIMDNDRDGEIEVSEFVKGFQKLKDRQNSKSVTVTAYVQEKVVEKHTKRPALQLPPPEVRRKSLKDSGLVKSLFGNKNKTPEIPDGVTEEDDIEV